MPDREGEQGSRTGLAEEIDAESGRGQHPRATLGELRGVVPRVAGDDARLRSLRALSRRDVIGQASGALADGAVVQDVCPDRIHLAAPPARAELQYGVESVVQNFPMAGLDVLGQSLTVLRERCLGEPAPDV